MVLVNSRRSPTLRHYDPHIATPELLYIHTRSGRADGNHSGRAVTIAIDHCAPNSSADRDQRATAGTAGATLSQHADSFGCGRHQVREHLDTACRRYGR